MKQKLNQQSEIIQSAKEKTKETVLELETINIKNISEREEQIITLENKILKLQNDLKNSNDENDRLQTEMNNEVKIIEFKNNPFENVKNERKMRLKDLENDKKKLMAKVVS